VKPTSTLTRVPIFDGTTATLTGRFRAPARVVNPAAIASADPAAETLGPTPNSAPRAPRNPTSQLTLGRKVLCSSPPTRITHSVTAESPFWLVNISRSNCQPNWVMTGETSTPWAARLSTIAPPR
jgi:hypothetical protein